MIQDSTKAKGPDHPGAINRQQSPGQTILNTINLIPGVNFTRSDAYGSSGGNIRIRGFDGNRISLTFDGVPLNDSGNYAIFSNQQLDPELIEQVNVNLGVDRRRLPDRFGRRRHRQLPHHHPDQRHGRAPRRGSIGDWDYCRVFGVVNTGEFTSFGTKAWFVGQPCRRTTSSRAPARSTSSSSMPASISRSARSGDFISIAGHYNQNRNNFYRNPSVHRPARDPRRHEIPTITGDAAVPTARRSDRDRLLQRRPGQSGHGVRQPANCNRTVPLAGVRQNDNGGTGPNGTGPNAPAASAASANNNPANASSCTNLVQRCASTRRTPATSAASRASR